MIEFIYYTTNVYCQLFKTFITKDFNFIVLLMYAVYHTHALTKQYECKIQNNWCTVTVAPTIEHHGGYSPTPTNQSWGQVPGRVSVSFFASRTRHECPRHNESVYMEAWHWMWANTTSRQRDIATSRQRANATSRQRDNDDKDDYRVLIIFVKHRYH